MPYDTSHPVSAPNAAEDVANCAERVIALTARWWGLLPGLLPLQS